jgi:hypothetical protein
VPSTSNGTTTRSKGPQHQANDEHNHSDRPDNWNTSDEPDEKKYQSKSNHNASC